VTAQKLYLKNIFFAQHTMVMMVYHHPSFCSLHQLTCQKVIFTKVDTRTQLIIITIINLCLRESYPSGIG